MIVSTARAYIFVHIPKTGGTAMALALEARARPDDILIGDTPKALRRKHRLKGVQTAGRLWKHSRLADIEGLVDPAAFDDFLIFTLVRNPWDRMVSYYSWLRAQGFDHPAVALSKTLEFADFLQHPIITTSFRAASYGTYLQDGTGTERQGIFVRIEALAEDLVPVSKHLGFTPDLPRANESARPRDWRKFYTDRDAAHLAEICAEDIARFGYRFDPGP
jgi:putative transposase